MALGAYAQALEVRGFESLCREGVIKEDNGTGSAAATG